MGSWWKFNYARVRLAGAGTQTAGLAFGGATNAAGLSSCTEEYNGSSWTESWRLKSCKKIISRSRNTNSSTWVWWLYTSWTIKMKVKNITEHHGTEGNNLNTARGYLAGFGIQTAALAVGGG